MLTVLLATGLLGSGDFPDLGSSGGSGFDDGGGIPGWFIAAFIAIGALAVLTFSVVIARGLSQWTANNRSPLVHVPAVVVTKRTELQGNSSFGSSGDLNDSHISSTSTYYWVTFEVQGGDRIELPVTGRQYGMLADGDRGQLTHQGTRFKGFDRTPQDR